MTVTDRMRDFIAQLLPASLFSCRSISVPEYSIRLGSGQEIRIAHISDLHSNDFGPHEEHLAKRIRETRPDLIVMTGDIFDKDMGPEKVFANVRDLMAGISGLCPIYYVPGNHEFYADETPFLSAIASYGATVLMDKAELAGPRGQRLVIAGLADPMLDLSAEERKKKMEGGKDSLRRRLACVSRQAAELARTGAGERCPTVLLAHRPEYIDDYAACGFDLVFSGHAHGGQWIIPGRINGVYAVGQGFLPKYAGGLYEIGSKMQGGQGGGQNVHFIVSRGLSYQKPAFPRFGNPPELPLVRLYV